MAQLTVTVRATRVHAPVMQQEDRVVASARHVFKTPPVEHATAPRLGDSHLRCADAQLTPRAASPAQNHDSYIEETQMELSGIRSS